MPPNVAKGINTPAKKTSCLAIDGCPFDCGPSMPARSAKIKRQGPISTLAIPSKTIRHTYRPRSPSVKTRNAAAELNHFQCLPTDCAITSTISTTTKEDMMPFIKLNCVTILNEHFDKKEQMKKHFSKWVNLAYGWNALRNLIFYGQHRFKGFANNHLAFSFLKSEYEDIWEKEYESLDDTSSHKFRSKLDLDNWLIRYWQLTRGNFYPIGRHVKGKVYEILKVDFVDFIILYFKISLNIL